jgi:hypothetical protein
VGPCRYSIGFERGFVRSVDVAAFSNEGVEYLSCWGCLSVIGFVLFVLFAEANYSSSTRKFLRYVGIGRLSTQEPLSVTTADTRKNHTSNFEWTTLFVILYLTTMAPSFTHAMHVVRRADNLAILSSIEILWCTGKNCMAVAISTSNANGSTTCYGKTWWLCKL